LVFALVSGCSSTEPYREIDVQLSSGKLMKNVRVLPDEEVEIATVSVVCRTFDFRGLKMTSRLTRPRPREICASPAYWASFEDPTRWVHPERGITTLPADLRECRKKGRWGTTRYNRCMEGKGYHAFNLDE
jgi:hypothetical protein